MIKVAVFGAKGRMGTAVCQAVEEAEDTELVAAVDSGGDRSDASGADVIVDFTTPDAVMDNLSWAISHDINTVVGTNIGCLVAPNFSIGAVLMMHFVEQAARFYESAEIVELHHPNKVDAPSGTARTTATKIAAARQEAGLGEVPDATKSQLNGARGAVVEGVHVHSVRLRGLVAHQEVLFGAEGETLTIRHDSMDRVSFMSGVLTGVRGVLDRPASARCRLDASGRREDPALRSI